MEAKVEKKKPTCCQCNNWNMGFDNSCAVRISKYNDFSNQPADQTACEDFEPEKL